MLLDDIIDLLGTSGGNLTDALMKTKILLYQIGRKDLAEWVNYETNGYPDGAILPEYRHLPAQVLGVVANIAYRYNKFPLPLAHLKQEQRKALQTVGMRQSLAVLEDLSSPTEGSITSPIPLEANRLLGKTLNKSYYIEQAWCEIALHDVRGILVQVRSRLLDFLLELKSNVGDVRTELNFNQTARTVDTSHIFSHAVFGPNTTIFMGDSNSQTIITITPGDFAALARQLSEIGISEEQLAELRTAIDEDKKAGMKPSLEGKTGNWLGRTITAVAKGGLKVARDVAVPVITKAVSSYLGLPP